MLKSNLIYYLFMIFPLLINFLMIILLMMPMKNKFHPISLMLMLILMTLFMSIKMNFIYLSLIPFILFLAMIGGLLVIFMYITSLTNNEFFYLNLKMIIMNLMKILPLMILLLYLYLNNPIYNFLNLNIQDSWQINLYQFIYDQFNLNIMYNEINNKSSMFIMLYIYYSMICIMNICFKLKSPLRQLMY